MYHCGEPPRGYSIRDMTPDPPISREVSSDATDIRLKNSILTYSKDGAHCTDAKGNVKWNQTYVIQDVKIATCGDVAAIGSYNGREIYVQNTDKQLGTITTTMPIRNITVAETGRVTAVLADTDVSRSLCWGRSGRPSRFWRRTRTQRGTAFSEHKFSTSCPLRCL